MRRTTHIKSSGSTLFAVPLYPVAKPENQSLAALQGELRNYSALSCQVPFVTALTPSFNARSVAGVEPTSMRSGEPSTRCSSPAELYRPLHLYHPSNCSVKMVRSERLELSHLSALEPKSRVSTNSTTSANMVPAAGIEPATFCLQGSCSTV